MPVRPEHPPGPDTGQYGGDVQHDAVKRQTLLRLSQCWPLAHEVLFKHRHPDETPDFHYKIIEQWHGPDRRAMTMAFRGGAKSTIAEEVVIIRAAFGLFRNGVLLGASQPLAVERLTAVKHELANNEALISLFGYLEGPVWNEDKVVLANGVVINARGRGQTLRGTKHLDARPDYLFGDDMEDEESTVSGTAIQKFTAWFMGVVLPSLDPKARVRVLGTPLAPGCFIEKLKTMHGWVHQRFPAEYKDLKTGDRTAMWAARFPLASLDDIHQGLLEAGTPHVYAQEYLMEAEDPAHKKFQTSYFKIVPHVRTWHPTLCVFDPAKTTDPRTSATTGHIVGSWIGRKLILWEGDGRFLMPDQIISEIFRIDNEYHPAVIGVEQDGLEEFLLQPLRHEQVKRNTLIPLKPLRAPQGKFRFIEALQAYFAAGEIEFAQPMPELQKQLLSYPTGRIDAPNALAYFLQLRGGQPIYDNFGTLHVAADLMLHSRAPLWLCCNSDGRYTSAVLCQYNDGCLQILDDWLREGDPGAMLGTILQQAGLECGKAMRIIVPARHWHPHDNVGMVAAARKIPTQIWTGGIAADGREEIRRLSRTNLREWPALRVRASAWWTINAMSYGYHREALKSGLLSDSAANNVYQLLMEGLEAFAALLQQSTYGGITAPINYGYTANGARFITAMPGARGGEKELKTTLPA